MIFIHIELLQFAIVNTKYVMIFTSNKYLFTMSIDNGSASAEAWQA